MIRGAIFNAGRSIFNDFGPVNHDSAARLVERYKTSSAEQPADNFGAVVLNSLLVDRE